MKSNKRVKQSIVDTINTKVAYYQFSVEWNIKYKSCIGIIDEPYNGFVDHEYEQGTVSLTANQLNGRS